MRSVIEGTGMFVPKAAVDNHRMSRIMDTSDEWIQQRTGIVVRHFAAAGVATSDLAVPAAEEALRDAGLAKDAIDYVVFATMNPDYYFPGSGAVFQAKAGLSRVPCLDIRQQCAGFIFGLQVADAMIRSGQCRRVLLIGAEVHSGLMPWKSWDILLGESDRTVDPAEFAWNTRFRDRAVLFGDGAGAVVVGRGEDGVDEKGGAPRKEGGGDARSRGPRGLLDVRTFTDGTHVEKMWVKGGGSAFRPYFSPEMYERGDVVPIVEGREVFKTAVTLMPEAVMGILDANRLTLEDVDLLVMHQANLRINEAVQKKLGLPDEKVFNNIQKYGNTTAATIPMAFHEARKAGRAKPGDLVCFVGLGSGLNWGAALYRC